MYKRGTICATSEGALIFLQKVKQKKLKVTD